MNFELYVFHSGYYRLDTKGAAVNDCTPCTGGYYCPTEGIVDPLECEKSNYSDTGAVTCLTCAAGYYCSQNATSWTYMQASAICPAGTECPPGMGNMPDLDNNPCRRGHYCLAGNMNPYPTPCPNGTFNAELGKRAVSECQNCTAGYYCTPEALEAVAGPCPGGYYCPTGTGYMYSNACPQGTYRNGSARESFQDCAECVAGYYCNQVCIRIFNF